MAKGRFSGISGRRGRHLVVVPTGGKPLNITSSTVIRRRYEDDDVYEPYLPYSTLGSAARITSEAYDLSDDLYTKSRRKDDELMRSVNEKLREASVPPRLVTSRRSAREASLPPRPVARMPVPPPRGKSVARAALTHIDNAPAVTATAALRASNPPRFNIKVHRSTRPRSVSPIRTAQKSGVIEHPRVALGRKIALDNYERPGHVVSVHGRRPLVWPRKSLVDAERKLLDDGADDQEIRVAKSPSFAMPRRYRQPNQFGRRRAKSASPIRDAKKNSAFEHPLVVLGRKVTLDDYTKPSRAVLVRRGGRSFVWRNPFAEVGMQLIHGGVYEPETRVAKSVFLTMPRYRHLRSFGRQRAKSASPIRSTIKSQLSVTSSSIVDTKPSSKIGRSFEEPAINYYSPSYYQIMTPQKRLLAMETPDLPPPSSYTRMRARVREVYDGLDRHKLMMDRYIRTDANSEEDGSNSSARASEFKQAPTPGNNRRAASVGPSVPSAPKMSEVRSHIRDVLCRTKKDPCYFK